VLRGGGGGGGGGGRIEVRGVGSDEGVKYGLGKLLTWIGWWRMKSYSAGGGGEIMGIKGSLGTRWSRRRCERGRKRNLTFIENNISWQEKGIGMDNIEKISVGSFFISKKGRISRTRLEFIICTTCCTEKCQKEIGILIERKGFEQH